MDPEAEGAVVTRSGHAPWTNRFWPYDLSREPGEPTPLRALDWGQHARMADFARDAAHRAVTSVRTTDEGAETMPASSDTSPDPAVLVSVLPVLADNEIGLGAFTDEELAAVDPPDDEPLVPSPLLDLVPEGGAREQVIGAALRSLLARGVVSLGEDPGSVRVHGPLATVLGMRSSPNSLLVVEHVEEDDPSRRVVYGARLQGADGEAVVVMEESVAVLGHHEFVLRSVEAEAQALADWLGGDAAVGNGHVPTGTLDDALDGAESISRIYAIRREDDGSSPDGEDISTVELSLVDGGPHGRWMVLFQEGSDEAREGILAVPVGRLDLPGFFAGLIRLDLGAFNAALAAG
jgi:hypothetical protein